MRVRLLRLHSHLTQHLIHELVPKYLLYVPLPHHLPTLKGVQPHPVAGTWPELQPRLYYQLLVQGVRFLVFLGELDTYLLGVHLEEFL